MSTIIELTQPGPAHPETGEQLPPQKINAVISQIAFVFKQPLQPVFMVGIAGAVMPCMGNYDSILKQLEAEGFTLLDTPEGTKTAVNHKLIAFYISPELGIYNLMFAGKAGLTVRATTAEIEGMWKEGSSILLDS